MSNPKPPNNPAPRATGPGPKTLAGVVGVFAAGMLLTLTPEEESGRKVKVDIAPDGSAKVVHVSGKQYLQAYLDSVGVATACDGITKGVRLGQRFTEEQCAEKLEQELVIHAGYVKRCSPQLFVRGKEYQLISAVLLAYNIGGAGYCGSTAARQFRAGNDAAACRAYLSWDKGTFSANEARRRMSRGLKCVPKRDGNYLCVIAGLKSRRERESKICMKGLN